MPKSLLFAFLRHSITFLILAACNNAEERSDFPTDQNRSTDKSGVITSLSDEQLNSPVPKDINTEVKFENTFKDLELGKSINSATKNVMGNLAVYNFTPTEINTKTLAGTKYDFKMVTDYYDLVKKFNLDVSASVKYFGFRLDAKYELAKSLSINKFHQFVAARVFIEDREESLKKIHLTAEALKIANKSKEAFVSKFGDEIITSKVIGGDLIALIEIESSSSASHESDHAHIEAAYSAMGGNGAKASVDLKSSLDEISKVSKYSIKIIYNGAIIGDSTRYSNIESVKSLIDTFPQTIHKSGKVLEYKLSSIFGAVEDLPLNITSTDFLPIVKQEYQLGTIENNINSILVTLPDLLFISENNTLFKTNEVDSANHYYNRNLQAIRAYKNNWKACASSPGLCDLAAALKYNIPQFHPTIDQSKLPPVPVEAEISLPLNTDKFQIVSVVHPSTTISLTVSGKVQYRNGGGLDCRTPVFSLDDFNISVGYYVPSGSGVFVKSKLMPLIQLQFFEADGNGGRPVGDPFYYTGKDISIPANTKDLLLKAHMDIVWVSWQNDVAELFPREVANKTLEITSHLFNCESAELKLKVLQK